MASGSINEPPQIIKEGRIVEETLRQICLILPDVWQFPQFTVARIKYQGMEVTSVNFKETHWVQKETFKIRFYCKFSGIVYF